MTKLNQTIDYVAFFGIGLCVLALLVLCIVWVLALIKHHIELKLSNMKIEWLGAISKMLGSLAFIVLALCALSIVVSCTIWMVQSILYAIW